MRVPLFNRYPFKSRVTLSNWMENHKYLRCPAENHAKLDITSNCYPGKKMSSTLPTFTFQQIERVARIIGDTENGLTGTQIGNLLAQLRYPDEGSTMTKWMRINNALIELQNKHKVGTAH